MTQPVPTHNDDVSGVIQRVHQLGMATESLFSRLYQSLSTKNKLAERQAAVAEGEAVVEQEIPGHGDESRDRLGLFECE